jgi:tetratricopeptide (TPR) repeat protein
MDHLEGIVFDFAPIAWLKPHLQKRSMALLAAAFGVAGMALYDVGKSYFTAGFEYLITTGRSVWEDQSCERRQASIKKEDDHFTILVSPLQGDDFKLSQTERVRHAFLNQGGFRLIQICESLGIDSSKKELVTNQIETAARGRAILRERGADLLIFGKVLLGDSLQVWAINDHGGCHFSPEPILLKNGTMPGEFEAETKYKLIGTTLSEVAAACTRQAKDIDWELLARQLTKMRNLLRRAHLTLPEQQLEEVSLAYYNGINRLYHNGGGDEWLKEALSFSWDEANAERTGDSRRAQAWLLHGRFSYTKSVTSGDKKDVESAIDAYSRSLKIFPTADVFSLRAEAYGQTGDHKSAIRDLDQAIQRKPDDADLYAARADAYSATRDHKSAIRDLDQAIKRKPDNAGLYAARADAYSATGDHESAIRDYDQAIQRKPDDAELLNNRCYELAKVGRLEMALADCNKSLGLRPDDANTLDSRGFTYLRMGRFRSAIADFDAALRLDRKLAHSLYGRALATLRTGGDKRQASKDIAEAKSMLPDVAVEFARYGLDARFRKHARSAGPEVSGARD